MRRSFATLLAVALAAVPALSKAQTTPAPAEPSTAAPLPAAPSEPAPAPVPAPKPAAQKVTITPYGFVLLQSFWNDGPFAARDYPGQVLQNGDGGAFIMSARGTRFGFKVALPDDPLTGAQLSGVIEADFKGGTTGTTSATWYNSIARIRLAYAQASWGDASSKFSLVIGQDWKIVAPLAPTSIAFGYDQIFTQAGNLNNRDQQIKAIYDGTFGGIGMNLSGAMLSPQDANNPTGVAASADYGAGNRSRKPNFEARAALNLKDGAKKIAELGVAGGIGWRRFNSPTATAATANATVDSTTKIVALDGVVNIPFLTVQGEAYASDGMEDSYTGLIGSAFIVSSTANRATSVTNVESRGAWVQAILKPFAFVQIPVGYGVAELRDKGLPNSYITGATRTRNSQLHAGLLFNMTNPWKFGFEVTHTISGYPRAAVNAQQSMEANQYVLASKLDF